MAGHRISLEQQVQAPPERVWQVLTDIEHADQTLSGVDRVEMLTAGPYRVGTRWRETRTMFGKQATEELEVTVVDAPNRTVVEADSSGVHYVTDFSLSPDASGGTVLSMTFTATRGRVNPLQQAMWVVFGRLGAAATRKVMAQDLRDIAARAERG
jgi:carbon monoxide dehydrogenase subunit G